MKEEFNEYINSNPLLTEWHIVQLKIAFKLNISMQHIKILGNPDLEFEQVEELITCITDELPDELLIKFIKEGISAPEIRRARINYLTCKDEKTTQPDFNEVFVKMSEESKKNSDAAKGIISNQNTIMDAVSDLNKLIQNEVALLNESINNNEKVLKEINSRIQIPQNTVQDKFVPDKKHSNISLLFCRKKKEKTILDILSSGEFNEEQMKELNIAYEEGIPLDMIFKIANPSLSSSKMQQLREIAKANLIHKNNGTNLSRKGVTYGRNTGNGTGHENTF